MLLSYEYIPVWNTVEVYTWYRYLYICMRFKYEYNSIGTILWLRHLIYTRIRYLNLASPSMRAFLGHFLTLSSFRAVACVLVVVQRLRAGGCPEGGLASTCPLPCSENDGACGASVAILKVPRTGSTWLTKELRAFPGTQLEFEPFTDPLAHTCAGRFYTLALGKALAHRLRCVTRESRSLPCYWGWMGCNATRLKPRAAPTSVRSNSTASSAHAVLTGFLINPMWATTIIQLVGPLDACCCCTCLQAHAHA